jgi:adenine-specific DNA-methyltransferase
MLLGRCEFGKEDYSLNIVNMPVDESENDFDAEEEISIQEINDNSKKKNNSEPTLFD